MYLMVHFGTRWNQNLFFLFKRKRAQDGLSWTPKMEADGGSVTAPGGGALPSSPVTCPLEQSTMQYSSWAGETCIQPNRQDLSKRFFPSQPAPCQQIPVCQNLSWLSKHDMGGRGGGAFSPTLPLAQRANVPLKMHIFAAHLAYLMHMHHTLGTKWNDMASDTEYPSSEIQFTVLQWAAGGGGGGWGGVLLVLPHSLNFGKVRNRKSTCWKTPIWMLLRQSSP